MQEQSRPPCPPLPHAHGTSGMWECAVKATVCHPDNPSRRPLGSFFFLGLRSKKSRASKNSRWVNPYTNLVSFFALAARKLGATVHSPTGSLVTESSPGETLGVPQFCAVVYPGFVFPTSAFRLHGLT